MSTISWQQEYARMRKTRRAQQATKSFDDEDARQHIETLKRVRESFQKSRFGLWDNVRVLRGMSVQYTDLWIFLECAADEIERLRNENGQLRKSKADANR